jgi:hypothetical protein
LNHDSSFVEEQARYLVQLLERLIISSRTGKRTKVANELLKGSSAKRKSHIIDKQKYSMKTKALSTLNFSAAC